MPVIESAGDLRSAEARANAEAMRELVRDLRETAKRVRLGGGQAARERHLGRGKLLPRDRVRTLIDPVSPFLEIGQLAAHGMYGGGGALRRPDRRHRPRRGARVHDRGQ